MFKYIAKRNATIQSKYGRYVFCEGKEYEEYIYNMFPSYFNKIEIPVVVIPEIPDDDQQLLDFTQEIKEDKKPTKGKSK